jgi:hypothetical protein
MDGDGHMKRSPWQWCEHVMIKLRDLEEREKQNGLKAKVISIGPFCFGDQDT